jgi:Skp family chaperone for outer membrane proteins
MAKEIKEVKDVLKDKKMMDKLLVIFLIVVALVFLLIAGNKFFGKSTRIYSADIDRIMNEHPALQEAMDNFQKELTTMQKKLDELEGEEKEKEQANMRQQIQEIAMRMQNEAVDKVMKDVRSIAEQKGYSYIIDKKSLIVGDKDVTDEILSVFKGAKEEKPAEEATNEPSDMPAIPVK